MKMGFTSAALVGVCVVVTSAAVGHDLSVSPHGNDSNSGTKQAPFATLSRARDAVRELRAAGGLLGPVTVNLEAGIYRLDEPFRLESSDSGSGQSPVTYQARDGADVTLLGGRAVTGWEPHENAVLKTDLAAQGLAGLSFRLLTFDGRRMQLARWPNVERNDINGGAWAHVAGERLNMYADRPGHDEFHRAHSHLDFWQRNVPEYRRLLTMKPEDVRPWTSVRDAEVSIFPRFNWWHYLLPIRSFDQSTGEIHLAQDSFYEIRPGDRYFIQGVYEELDQPGEWYLDSQTDTLYFWPPEPMDGKCVYVPVVKNAVVMDGCDYVTIKGVTIECCEETAITLRGCRNCTIAASTLRNLGGSEGHAVAILDGASNRVVGNDIHHIGSYGVYLKAGATLTDCTLTDTVIDNNYIHHVGLVGRHAKGIELQGLRNLVTHNLIHDIPQSGIYVWSANDKIEYNHIRHTCLEGEDTGAIGGGAIDWLGWQATKVRYNLITDTLGYGYDEKSGKWESPHFTWGLYPDWAASDVEIVGNIVVRAPRGLLHLHSGRDNLIENNIFVDGVESQVRLAGWTTRTGFWSTRVDQWTKTYDEAMQQDKWRALGTLDDPRTVPLEDSSVMHGNVFRRNICCYHDGNATLFDVPELPLKEHRSDHNLIFSAAAPLRTGRFQLRETTGPNLLANPGLEGGPADGFPEAWGNLSKTVPDASATVEEATGRTGRALCVFSGTCPEGDITGHTVYLTVGSVPFEPGQTYVFSLWIKAETLGLNLKIGAFSWKQNVHNWYKDENAAVGRDWTRYELLFRTPAPGDGDYAVTMERVYCRVTVPAGTGRFRVDDVALHKAETLDEWESWQAHGLDTHSLVADPLFVNAAEDDYRLEARSPAWDLGFERIPVEKIGPYAHSNRATWPIVEASGARESLARRPERD
jgi:hypothetical protein